MADIQFDINLDLVEKYVPAENVTVVQEDFQSVKFLFTILNREQPVDLTGATDIVVSFVKPDGHLVLQNDATLVNGKVELVANPQAFTYVGKTYFQVQYKIDAAIYNTRQAFLWVEKGHTSCQTVSSTDFAPMLDQAIQAGQMLAGIDLQALIDSKVTAENAQADVDALELRVGALEVTIVGLDSRVDALEASQATQGTAISGLQTSQATQDTKITNLETGQSGLNSRVTSVEGNITTVINEVDALQLTAVDHETRIDGLEASMPNLSPIEADITALKAKDVQQDGRIGANELAISGFQNKNTQQDTAIAGNATEIGKLQAEQTTQNNRLTAVENKSASQDSAIGDIQTKNTKQESAISALQGSQAAQDTDIAAIKTKNTQQDTAIAANSTSIAAVDNKVDANKAAQDTVNFGVTGTLSNHTTRIEALEANATVDDARIVNLEGDNTSNKSRIATAEGAIGVLNSDINDLQGNDAVQDSRLNAIETKNTTQDGLIADNSAAIVTNKNDADSKITGLNARLGIAEGDITGLKTKDNQQDTKLSDIETKNATQDSLISTNTTAINTANSEINSIKTDRNLPNLNSLYLSTFYKKMQTEPISPYGNTVSITCQGDSMTEGDGATAGNDYPAQLQGFLNSIARTGQVVTVVNRGIGGDTTKMSYDHWPTPSGSDLCIIYLGTNDYNKNTTMIEFADYYERLIKREISNGTAVFLVTPHRWRKADWMTKPWNGSVSDYASMIKNLGMKYNAPVLDLLSETRNLDRSAYKAGEADPGIHFGDTGHKMLAHKLGATLGFQHPKTLPVISNNSFISVRPSIDGIKKPDEYYIMHTSSSYPTPREIALTSDEGIGIMADSTEKVFHYSFYTDEDNLAIIPSFFFTASDGSEKIEVVIDGNNIPFQPSNLYQYNNTLNRTLPIGQMLLTMADFPLGHARPTTTQNIFANSVAAYYRYLPTKGWHTVTVKIKNCRFHGFDFMNTPELDNKNAMAKKNEVVPNTKDGTVNLTLTVDAENPDTAAPLIATRRGSVVNIRGSVRIKTGATGVVVTTLPTDMRPVDMQVFYEVSFADNTSVKVVIFPNGNVSVYTQNKSLYLSQVFVVN